MKRAKDNYCLSGGLTQQQRLAMVEAGYPSHESVWAERREQKARTPRKRKGLNGITGYGSKMVRNGCYLLEQWLGKDRLGFLTLTLPSNPAYKWLLVLDWAECVRKFVQEFRRELERQGALAMTIYVTEIQEKRSRKEGMPIPHLHLVFEAWDGKSYTDMGKRRFYIPWQKIQKLWKRILENEIKRLDSWIEGNELDDPIVDVQTIRKSAEGYLGKYMTKGKSAVVKLLQDGFRPGDLPSQWWGCDKTMRDAIHSGVTALPRDIALAVVSGVDLVARGVAKYLRKIEATWSEGVYEISQTGSGLRILTDTNERTTTVGWALRLHERWNQGLREALPETG